MRVWHSAWSWLKLIVAAESVAGNTRIGMFTRLILRKPFQVGRAAIESPPLGNYRSNGDQKRMGCSDLHGSTPNIQLPGKTFARLPLGVGSWELGVGSWEL